MILYNVPRFPQLQCILTNFMNKQSKIDSILIHVVISLFLTPWGNWFVWEKLRYHLNAITWNAMPQTQDMNPIPSQYTDTGPTCHYAIHLGEAIHCKPQLTILMFWTGPDRGITSMWSEHYSIALLGDKNRVGLAQSVACPPLAR